MNTEEFERVNRLDYDGRHQEAFDLVCKLSEENDPMALFDLSIRFYSSEGQWPEVLKIKPDLIKSNELADAGKRELESLANTNDGEAMRMLAYLYLGHLCPYHKDINEAEAWLLKSVAAECHFASNDLATFYQNNNVVEAKKWYKYAEDHGCRVIQNSNLET
jgi:TPR repeat protein